jgi:cobalt-zinc-cadmium efflux system outer membrane protein
MKDFEARTLDSPDLQRYVAAHLKSDASRPAPNTWDLTTLTLAAFYFSPELDVARAKAGASQPLLTISPRLHQQCQGRRIAVYLWLGFGYSD